MKKLFLLMLCCCMFTSAALAGDLLVKGLVKDSSGEPIIGATIVVVDSTIGVVSGLDGDYQINVPSGNSEIVFSYIGYKDQQVAVNNRTNIDIVLEATALSINDVVVVGYGVQRKTDVTSAVASVKAEDFSAVVPNSSPLQMVQGKIPGLAMSRAGGGDPTADVSLQIRGVSTLNAGTSPLIIIDGIPGGDLSSVASNDIASIDVLRDGSAAAIYGSRGTSGVVIITTKKGSYNEKMRIQYDGTISADEVANKWNFLSGDQYRTLNSSLESSNDPIKQTLASAMFDFGGDSNAFDEITRTAFTQQHYLSLTSGSENSNITASVKYRDTEGVIIQTGMTSLNGRIATEFRHFNDMLTVNMNLSYSEKEFQTALPEALKQSSNWNPTNPLYNENGGYTPSPDLNSILNPVNIINENTNISKKTNMLADAKITLKPMDGLSLAALMSIDKRATNYGSYTSSVSEVNKKEGVEGSGSRRYSEVKNSTIELTANYTRKFGETHMDVLGGYSYQLFEDENFYMYNRDFLFDDNSYNNMGAGEGLVNSTANMSSFKGESKLISFFARAVFNVDNRYLFNATVRHEGSSRFGMNNRWGTFPSASFAWRAINESFMENQTIFDDLKFRLGYGVTGNMIDQNYLNDVLYSASGEYFYDGNDWVQAYSPKTNVNPDLRWETKKELNAGVDMSFLDGRISTSVDYYSRTSEDILYEYSVPVPPYLASTMWGNIGTISNKGVEFNINATPIAKKDFTWNANLNFSYNKNNVDKLSVGSDVQKKYEYNLHGSLYGLQATIIQEGAPLGNFYGWKYAGVDGEGNTLVYVLDGDENVAYDESGNAKTVKFSETRGVEDNKTIIGNGMPQYYVNMGHSFQYKNFDLSFLFRGVFGFDILNETAMTYNTINFKGTYNALDTALDNPCLDGASYTDQYVENGNFVKLDNITLGYNIPISKQNFIQRARLYASIQNVCTFTNYSGNNPELEISGTQVGIETYSPYPVTRTYTLGLNLTF